MTHRNAPPLTVEGRRRLIERCQSRPIAHVAAEMGISRQCASTWVNRYRKFGELGLQDRSSTPHHQPTATAAGIVAEIEAMRRTRKWSASRITFELRTDGITIARRTVTKILRGLGLHRRRFIDPNGETNRKPQVIVAKRPGQMVHVDIKKLGKIPRRRRVACPRPRLRAGQTIAASENEEQASPGRVHLFAFRDRREHPPGVHRGPRQRNRRNSHRFHEQRPTLLRRTRHHPNRARDYRQRVMLSGSRFHRFTPRSSALPHPAVHPRNTTGKSNGTTASSPKNFSTPANTAASSNDAPPSKSGMFTTITTDRIQHAEDDRPPLTAGTASPTSVPPTARPLYAVIHYPSVCGVESIDDVCFDSPSRGGDAEAVLTGPVADRFQLLR